MRGTQFTAVDGRVAFDTIYPGWYPGRTPHIHFKVILDDKERVTGQLYFPDTASERIYAAHSPYRERKQDRDTVNANDFIFREEGEATLAEIERRAVPIALRSSSASTAQVPRSGPGPHPQTGRDVERLVLD